MINTLTKVPTSSHGTKAASPRGEGEQELQLRCAEPWLTGQPFPYTPPVNPRESMKETLKHNLTKVETKASREGVTLPGHIVQK